MAVARMKPIRGGVHAMPDDASAGLCVLASSSGGNASVLIARGPGGSRRVVLIDAGLSPRRTVKFLAERGVEPWEVDAVLLTHLDTDHFHPGWYSGSRHGRLIDAPLRMHRGHLGRAERGGMLGVPCEPFDDGGAFEVVPGVRTSAVMMSHDHLGVAAFRFEIDTPDGRSATLGFATDLGRVTGDLTDHLRGVGVLAIESNYCPQMQADSDRPVFLKRRITGGAGHLSNHEAHAAVEAIGPREHVVFLHLSRQCNTPETVAALHAGSDYPYTIASHDRPTRWVWMRTHERAAPTLRVETPPIVAQPSLFAGADPIAVPHVGPLR